MKYDGTNLNEVLELHKKWINGEDDGERANLNKADLFGKDLSGVDLSGADISEANLIGALFIGADLSRACLNEADLSGANLAEAFLIGADLSGACLSRACLAGADLRGIKNAPFIPMTCPDSGSFVGWKKCRAHMNDKELIVKLLIPEDAKRSSATGRKCRCDKAVVLEIQNLDGSKSEFDTAYSIYEIYSIHEHVYKPFAYKLGEMVVSANGFCEDRFIECAAGIHFFINRQEAVDY